MLMLMTEEVWNSEVTESAESLQLKITALPRYFYVVCFFMNELLRLLNVST